MKVIELNTGSTPTLLIGEKSEKVFLTVPALFWSMIPIAIVAAMATFAAVQEGHFIRTKQFF